jgi:hypothetical protein
MKRVVAAVLVLCVGMLLLAGCSLAREKSCREQSEVLTQLNALIRSLLSTTSAGGRRLGRRQEERHPGCHLGSGDVKKDMRGLDPPSCAHDLQVNRSLWLTHL